MMHMKRSEPSHTPIYNFLLNLHLDLFKTTAIKPQKLASSDR